MLKTGSELHEGGGVRLPPTRMTSSVTHRAHSIVGKSKHEYSCNHVVNFALTGDKYFSAWEASDYLKYGRTVPIKQVMPMDVVVASDGSHVGIFVSRTEWIHAGQTFTRQEDTNLILVSSWNKQKVEKVGLDQLRHVFPTGFEIRRAIRKKATPKFSPPNHPNNQAD